MASESGGGGSQINPNNEQNTNLTGDSTQVPDLPNEITIEILARLPVKAILRFRCVCKPWRSLISDPQFVKKHLHMSTIDDNYTHHRLIITPKNPGVGFKSFSLYSICNELSDYAVELDYPMYGTNQSNQIIGSCYGLLCTAIGRKIVFLWNPCTRKFRRLSEPRTVTWGGPYCIRYVSYGFGYDYSIDDYKVVGVFGFLGLYGSESEVRVYTLRTDSWRRIEDFPYGPPHDEPGKFVSGALNWPLVREHDGLNFSWIIIALDLATETYQEVPQPVYGDTGYDRTLGVLGGCLSILANYRGARADVWVMKEYGVRESWTKMLTIPYLIDLWSSGYFPYYRPLCFSKNGEMLLEFKSLLVIYNPKDNSFRSPVIRGFPACLKADIFIESLVSPNAEDRV